jgi:hypothetical protein
LVKDDRDGHRDLEHHQSARADAERETAR